MARGDGSQVDRDIGREHRAPAAPGRSGVEPALDHHVEPGNAQPEHDPKDDPGHRAQRQRVQQRNDGAERGDRGVDADMPHPRDQRRHQIAAQHEAGEIGRADRPDPGGAEALDPGAQGHQGQEQAVAQHQQRDPRQQGSDRREQRSRFGEKSGYPSHGMRPLGTFARQPRGAAIWGRFPTPASDFSYAACAALRRSRRRSRCPFGGAYRDRLTGGRLGWIDDGNAAPLRRS